VSLCRLLQRRKKGGSPTMQQQLAGLELSDRPTNRMTTAERDKFRLITGHGRSYGSTKVEEVGGPTRPQSAACPPCVSSSCPERLGRVLRPQFIYAGYRKQKIEKTKSEVARMRDRVEQVKRGQAERRKAEEISHDQVGAMLQNLESVKMNSRKFLTAQANKSLRDEIAANHQRLAAKLFQAAAAGNTDECLEILRDEASAAERLAQLGGPDDPPYVEGQPSALANAVDADGRRPLHYAANHGDEKVIATLLEAGADESAVDCNGYTALHYACRWAQARAVDQLVWAPQNDINATDSFGQTALHVAAASGGAALVNVLIMRGARPSQTDHDGNTCLDIATLHGDDDFKAAVRLATEVGNASLAFGPGEFDIVEETKTMTDEREVTAAIISEVFELGKASEEELDGGVLTMENSGAQEGGGVGLMLGVSDPAQHPPYRTLFCTGSTLTSVQRPRLNVRACVHSCCRLVSGRGARAASRSCSKGADGRRGGGFS
jgi:hypothetical protein